MYAFKLLLAVELVSYQVFASPACVDKLSSYCPVLDSFIDVCDSPYVDDCCLYCGQKYAASLNPASTTVKPCSGNLFSWEICAGRQVVYRDFCQIGDEWSVACCQFCKEQCVRPDTWTDCADLAERIDVCQSYKEECCNFCQNQRSRDMISLTTTTAIPTTTQGNATDDGKNNSTTTPGVPTPPLYSGSCVDILSPAICSYQYDKDNALCTRSEWGKLCCDFCGGLSTATTKSAALEAPDPPNNSGLHAAIAVLAIIAVAGIVVSIVLLMKRVDCNFWQSFEGGKSVDPPVVEEKGNTDPCYGKLPVGKTSKAGTLEMRKNSPQPQIGSETDEQEYEEPNPANPKLHATLNAQLDLDDGLYLQMDSPCNSPLNQRSTILKKGSPGPTLPPRDHLSPPPDPQPKDAGTAGDADPEDVYENPQE